MKAIKHLLLLLFLCFLTPLNSQTVDVGVILDVDTIIGKMSNTCMSMALTDFYASHNYSTRISLHIRDSKNDIVDAASAAIDLLKNVQVKAILGPQQSTQADFVVDIGNKSQVPVISFTATSPSLSHLETPYFIRTAPSDFYQVNAIATIVKAFNWREIVPIYENTNHGSGVIPYLADALKEMGARVPYRCVISPLATDDQILKELYNLKTKQTRVFVVHMLPSLASRIFSKAKEAGMMRKGYAWIITDGITSLLDTMESSVIDSMQGVIGVKHYIPKSKELDVFTERWRQTFHQENPDINGTELNAYGLWAYDSISALAMAVERVAVILPFKKPVIQDNLTDLAEIGISEIGPAFLQSISNTKFKGLSGYFQLIDGELQSSAFQVVNVIGKDERGSPTYSISKKLTYSKGKGYTISKDDLGVIKWPGESIVVPKGWEIPTSEKILKVGVPVKQGFTDFVEATRDPQTNATHVRGFCIEVFEEVMRLLPYSVPFEYYLFETFEGSGQSAGDHDKLVNMVYNESYDAVVGDITILANRSSFVDFTLPFTESGVSMIVPVKDNEKKNAWIFMKPLTMDVWLTTGAFFIFTGFVVWVLEHRVNADFRGPPANQIGMIFWFSFSTLVYAHKEKVISNLSRFVVIVWILVVLVLTTSFTASLTSMLTVQQLQPTITDINDLIKNGECVGYQKGSFVPMLLEKLKVDTSKLREYSTLEEYEDALSKGSKNGGVGAIMDELPYLRLFLMNYCKKYIMVGPTYKTAGFGFAFPKGSPLVPDVSRAVLDVTEGDKMIAITRSWFRDNANCESTTVTSNSLTLDSFKGLFLTAGVSSCSALFIFLFIFLCENRNILMSKDTTRKKFVAIAKTFSEKKQISSNESLKETATDQGTTISAINEVPQEININVSQSPPISFTHQDEGFFSQDEGFTSTEPATPYHDLGQLTEEFMEKMDL